MNFKNKLLICIQTILIILFCGLIYKEVIGQTISPEKYLQFYSNEYFSKSDSVILLVSFERSDYLSLNLNKKCKFYCRSFFIKNNIYRFELIDGVTYHIPINNTYGFKIEKVKKDN